MLSREFECLCVIVIVFFILFFFVVEPMKEDGVISMVFACTDVV